jgi:hypothetical protein
MINVIIHLRSKRYIYKLMVITYCLVAVPYKVTLLGIVV